MLHTVTQKPIPNPYMVDVGCWFPVPWLLVTIELRVPKISFSITEPGHISISASLGLKKIGPVLHCFKHNQLVNMACQLFSSKTKQYDGGD